MCRLYGFRANEPTKVECTLVRAQNALMIQSRGDLRGQTHPDGWGIAVYENHLPTVERHARAAYEDLHFSVTAERVFSCTVVAHIRDATVGQTSALNTHPFHHGPWVFAHNGTVRGFVELESEMEAELIPELRAERAGSTDSEMAFLWLMSRLHAAGVPLDCARPLDRQETERFVGAMAGAIAELSERCRAADTEQVERLNFLITNGPFLAVSRWHNGLVFVERDGVHDCEICGIPHVHHDKGTRYRAVVVASEPISQEDWREVPDQHILVGQPGVRSRLEAI